MVEEILLVQHELVSLLLSVEESETEVDEAEQGRAPWLRMLHGLKSVVG